MKGELKKNLDKWLSERDLKTYDPKDILFSEAGKKIKNIYYCNKLVGIFPAALLQIGDFLFNGLLRRSIYQKHRYPIVYGLNASINTKMFLLTNDSKYLNQAKESINWLLDNHSKGYAGYCWGMNLSRVTKNGAYDANTPYNTNTPYVLEALHLINQVNEYKNEYITIIKSVYNHLVKDIPVQVDNDIEYALSYSPVEEPLIVYNSNSYCLYMFTILSVYVERKEQNKTLSKINRLYQFLCNGQNDDGSWYYYTDKTYSGNFIDCFHSCFILKNIIKANNIVALEKSEEVVQKGYDFLKKKMYNPSKQLMNNFYIKDKPTFIKYELYDSAEMLNIAVLLKDYEFAKRLNKGIMKYFFKKEHIYSQIDILGNKHYKDCLRWSIYPYLNGLANYLIYEKN